MVKLSKKHNATIDKVRQIGKQNRKLTLHKFRIAHRRRLYMMKNRSHDGKGPINLPDNCQNPRLITLIGKLMSYQGADIIPKWTPPTAKKSHDERAFGAAADAAVLVAITNEAAPKILLTRRASHMNQHAGEVSFVGGKADETDRHTAHTALREAYEEVGLSSCHVSIIGYLPMQLSKAGLYVRPVVALIDPIAVETLRPSADEIARVFWLPFDAIIDTPPTAHRLDNQYHGKAIITPAWLFDMDQDGTSEVVWGLTGRILANLAEIGFGAEYEWYYRVAE